MKVYVMTAEHFSVPGIITKVCATRDLAVKEAIVCVYVMLVDAGKPIVETEEEMSTAIAALQEEHGAAYFVEISEHEVIGTEWSERSPRQWSLIERVNIECGGEGWCLCVCGDGMIVIDTDHDSPVRKPDAYPYVEGRADGGSLTHKIARSLHGMIMTENK